MDKKCGSIYEISSVTRFSNVIRYQQLQINFLHATTCNCIKKHHIPKNKSKEKMQDLYTEIYRISLRKHLKV